MPDGCWGDTRLFFMGLVLAGFVGLREVAGRDELRVEGPGLWGLDAAAKEQVRDPHDVSIVARRRRT
jgi:hypothetical protein